MELTYKTRFWCTCGKRYFDEHKDINCKACGKGNPSHQIIKDICFCCDEMEETFKDRTIVFGEYDNFHNTNTNVNIIKCSPWPEGTCYNETPIKFCPFCAKSITTKNIGEV